MYKDTQLAEQTHSFPSGRSSTVDSLFKTLLAIDILQPTLITNLLERLPEFYDELEQE
jgi:Fanconi anemia group D2 protein